MFLGGIARRFREIVRGTQLMLNLEQDENLSKSYFIWKCRRKKFLNSNPADKSASKPLDSRNFSVSNSIISNVPAHGTCLNAACSARRPAFGRLRAGFLG